MWLARYADDLQVAIQPTKDAKNVITKTYNHSHDKVRDDHSFVFTRIYLFFLNFYFQCEWKFAPQRHNNHADVG